MSEKTESMQEKGYSLVLDVVSGAIVASRQI
jgi:hypothetical protein